MKTKTYKKCHVYVRMNEPCNAFVDCPVNGSLGTHQISGGFLPVMGYHGI
jgi:hypothetical protein